MFSCPLSVSRYWPSLEKDSARIAASITRLRRVAPVAESQSLTVPSPEADATSLLSGEKAMTVTHCEWPSSVWHTAPVAESQSLTVPSPEADATSLLSG